MGVWFSFASLIATLPQSLILSGLQGMPKWLKLDAGLFSLKPETSWSGRKPRPPSARRTRRLRKVFWKVFPGRVRLLSRIQPELLAGNRKVLRVVHPGPVSGIVLVRVQQGDRKNGVRLRRPGGLRLLERDQAVLQGII